MHYCLDGKQLSNLICFRLCNQKLDKQMELIIENSVIWEDEVSIINYLFSHILESIPESDNFKYNCIQEIYNLKDEMFVTIQEFDYNFIKCMLLFDVNNKLNYD